MRSIRDEFKRKGEWLLMAQLPMDRTKLQAAVSNQQPSIVASAKANREYLVESADTIDLLYQFVLGLISDKNLANLTLPKNSKNNNSRVTDFPVGYSMMRVDTALGFPLTAGILCTYRPESEANGFQTIVNTGGGFSFFTRQTLNGVFQEWNRTVTKVNDTIPGPLTISGSKVKVFGTWAGFRMDATSGTSAR